MQRKKLRTTFCAAHVIYGRMMIASLRGKLLHKETETVVVDVQGVGYRLHIPLSTFYDLPDLGEEVSIRVQMVVREDAIELFGFLTEAEREAFVSLTGVAGIGPRLARNILSGISPEALAEAVFRGDGVRLQAIPGVGRRMAERILVDLQGKTLRFGAEGKRREAAAQRGKGEDQLEDDVFSALLNLGYRRSEISKVLHETRQIIRGPLTAEVWLKETLRLLVK